VGLTLFAAPAEEPLTLPEARLHLKVDGDEDSLIDGLILAARQHVETYTRRALITQTWDLTADHLGCELILPRNPVQSVTSVQYLDAQGASQTLLSSLYRVVKRDTGETAIVPAYGAIWPSTCPVEAAVTVRFVSGYGAAAAVPAPLKHAMLLLIGHWYAHRETVHIGGTAVEVPMSAEALMFPYRVFY
jgi:uncharacterized phiE125 gp8 family phage protein